MDVTGGRVDVGMAEQGLHDGEINARFGECGAERVAKCVRMTAWDTSRRPVIAKDRAQARRSQRLTAVGSFGHHEQAGGLGLWAFGEEVGLNDPSYVHVKWNTALFRPFPADPQPPPTDVDIANIESQHFAGPQATKHHQSRHRPVSPGPQAPHQCHDVAGVQRTRKPLGFSKSQRRSLSRTTCHVSEQAVALTSTEPSRFPASRDRVLGIWVTHRSELEQTRDRGQTIVHRRRRVSVGTPPIHAHHIRARSTRNRYLSACSEIAQQHVGVHCVEIDLLLRQPTAECQQREPVDADRLRRVVPIRQVAQVFVHQREPLVVTDRQDPTIRSPLKPKLSIDHHNICNRTRH